MAQFHAQRLVDQLRQLGIEDQSVLDAIGAIPREMFLSEAMHHQAYDNNALPIGCGQTISQPYIVAKMTSLLKLEPTSKVLEIGTGCGYQTAILSQLVQKVYSVERIKTLQWDAKRRLSRLNIYNIATKHGDGWMGWNANAPYDAIIVTAAASEVPAALIEQLVTGGRLIIPVGIDQQHLYQIVKTETGIESCFIEHVRFVPLVHGELA
ncbi:protein-L-isoaspartate(D-aspartate) O-methyltransferase [Vibrio gallicus]|uniref:protein-L-isoaspartate(D-aspartate) O-methyltransferase n=1 Tax=Vibrio gallicus TaxID=190897 RepID=UPI0021C2F388|nr:protein-L-isoaspartate(D-aspartate) O-methyltransferase [Vibrio gallicus]